MEFIDFILGKVKTGILQLITLGGLGIWTIIDLILVASQNFKDSNENEIKDNNKKHLIIIFIICIIITIINTVALISGLKNFNRTKASLTQRKIIFEKFKPRMQVFMDYEATESEINQLKKDLSKIEGINIVNFISKEDAYNEIQKKLGEKGKELKEITSDIFSVSYIITVSDIKEANKIYNRISDLENVRNITNGYETLELYNKIKNSIQFYEILIISVIIIRIIDIFTIMVVNIIIIKKIMKINGK